MRFPSVPSMPISGSAEYWTIKSFDRTLTFKAPLQKHGFAGEEEPKERQERASPTLPAPVTHGHSTGDGVPRMGPQEYPPAAPSSAAVTFLCVCVL